MWILFAISTMTALSEFLCSEFLIVMEKNTVSFKHDVLNIIPAQKDVAYFTPKISQYYKNIFKEWLG